MNTELNKTKRTDVYNVDPRNINIEFGHNARKDFDLDALKPSIKANGVLNTILVRRMKLEADSEKAKTLSSFNGGGMVVADDGYTYILADGERRLRSCWELINEGVEIFTIKADVVARNVNELDMSFIMLERNNSKEFNAMEMADAYNIIIARGGTTAMIAERTGKHQSYISNIIALHSLAESVKNDVREGKVAWDVALQLRSVTSGESEMIALLDETKEQLAEKGKEGKKITANDVAVLKNKKEKKEVANVLAKSEKELLKQIFNKISEETTNNTNFRTDFLYFYDCVVNGASYDEAMLETQSERDKIILDEAKRA